jgi:protein-S-isoprenylcysteine O-methyltransferase Ste14
MPRTFQSLAYVLLQLACLLYIALSGPLVATHKTWLAMEVCGIAVGVWALTAMRLTRIRVFPEPARDQQLITAGPYRLVRHPMYTSVLLTTLALVIDAADWARVAVWMLLCAVLWVKLRYEERLLVARYPEYEAYMRGTRRLVPWIL